MLFDQVNIIIADIISFSFFSFPFFDLCVCCTVTCKYKLIYILKLKYLIIVVNTKEVVVNIILSEIELSCLL